MYARERNNLSLVPMRQYIKAVCFISVLIGCVDVSTFSVSAQSKKEIPVTEVAAYQQELRFATERICKLAEQIEQMRELVSQMEAKMPIESKPTVKSLQSVLEQLKKDEFVLAREIEALRRVITQDGSKRPIDNNTKTKKRGNE